MNRSPWQFFLLSCSSSKYITCVRFLFTKCLKKKKNYKYVSTRFPPFNCFPVRDIIHYYYFFCPQSCSIETCLTQNQRKAATELRSLYRLTCLHKCKNFIGLIGLIWWPVTAYRWTDRFRTSVKNRNYIAFFKRSCT